MGTWVYWSGNMDILEWEQGMLEWEPGFTGVETWVCRMEMWSMYWNENMNRNMSVLGMKYE